MVPHTLICPSADATAGAHDLAPQRMGG
jgi:hypothetical protein